MREQTRAEIQAEADAASERIWEAVAALTHAWLVMKAMDGDEDSYFINVLASKQHERVERAIVELIDAGIEEDLMDKKLQQFAS
jgi:hypothetical protein